MNNDKQLRPGETFLLRAGTEYFLSTIESVTGRSLEVTVPSKDYPPPGMRVSMDFHDDDGCTIYNTKVVSTLMILKSRDVLVVLSTLTLLKM